MKAIYAQVNVLRCSKLHQDASLLIEYQSSVRGAILLQIFGVVLSILTCSPLLSATTIVIAANFNHRLVVIGADSLVSGRGGMDSASVCKIHVRRSCVFVTAGLSWHPATDFVPDELAETACSLDAPVNVKADRFAAMALDGARRVHLDIVSSPQKRASLAERDLNVEAAFISVERGVPRISVRSLRITKEGVFPVTPQDFPHPNMPGLILMLGAKASIQAFMDQNPQFTVTTPAREVVRQFVGMEIANNPQTVGPPISVLQLSVVGSGWLEQGLCSASQQ